MVTSYYLICGNARIYLLGGPPGGEKTLQGWVRGGLGSLENSWG